MDPNVEDFLHTADKHYLRINLCSFFSTLPNNECQLWHNRLGHSNSKKLLFLLNFGVLLNKFHLSYKMFLLISLVVTWERAKLFLFPHVGISTTCYRLVHTDVWRIIPTISHPYDIYFVTFIDDYNQFTYISCIQNLICLMLLKNY